GGIDIETSLQSQDDDVQIKQVSFYIDNRLKHEDTTAPYKWTWDEKIIGKYTIKVEAYDSTDNMLDSDQIEVSIFNLDLK
ncbi:MAG: Ig-like domain-containing protein, partial [Candidatus Thermoplasmatota archaeon]